MSCRHQIGETVVTAHHLAVADERPFAHHNPRVGVIHPTIGERIAHDDVALQQIRHRLATIRFALLAKQPFVLLAKVTVEPLAASLGIVGQKFDAVDAAHRPHGMLLILQLGELLAPHTLLTHRQLAAQNLDKKVAVATRRLQETALDAFRFLPDEVEHRVHLPFGGEHLSMLRHTLLRLDLPLLHWRRSGHQASIHVVHVLSCLAHQSKSEEYRLLQNTSGT